MSYALVSLIEILDQILHSEKHHKNWVVDHEKESEIQTLLEKACFLRDFLAKPPVLISHDRLEELEDLIVRKAQEVEDALESYITEQILSSSAGDHPITISPPDLWDHIVAFDDIAEDDIEEIMEAAAAKETPGEDDDVSRRPELDERPVNAVSSMRDNKGKLVVGLEKDLLDLKDRLTRGSSQREIITIVGKHGSGKTTLAGIIYHEYSSRRSSHFDVCAWGIVSEDSNSQKILEALSDDSNSQKILSSLVSCVTKLENDEISKQECSNLVTALHKQLYHRRYLIVLDGIRNSMELDKLLVAFPEGEGSRILLTTRKHDVTDYAKPQICHKMRPLSNDECWDLLTEKVYGEELCPRELEQVGKRIASNCKGLPLEVQQVGGLLSKVDNCKDSWEEFLVSLKSRNLVVGVEKDLEELKNRLLGGNNDLEIIPIVGMGGTGKTTLARVLFDELSFSGSHFEVCTWAVISQTYDPKKVLQSLLDFVAEKSMHVQEIGELIKTLRDHLLSRRYLILLDDIWSSKAVEYLKAAFPDNKQGSRIILTTRVKEWDTKVYACSHEMKSLKENDSWELLRRKVFDHEPCPVELIEVGKKIAIKCRGLPLAVQVVGGLLSQTERSQSSWEHVVEDVSSFIENEDKQFSEIFSWSYFHLPHYLKPCFLYMGMFPEDHNIRASKLIKLWVSDGFLSPFEDRSPEESAEKYLTDLVARSLILVRERKENFKVKSYGIHDLLRDLCFKKARETKFLYAKDLKTNKLEVDIVHDQRRVSVHSTSDHMQDDDSIPVILTPLVRSFQPIGLATTRILGSLCFELSLLRQLDLFETEFREFPEEILKLVNLRYLAMRCVCGPPESISVLRNLQTLIFQILEVGYFALGIFDAPQVRHVKLHGPEVEVNPVDLGRSFAVQENLQSLSTIPLGILEQLVGKIPNLRRLGVLCSGSSDMVDLTCLDKLEALNFSSNLSMVPRFLQNVPQACLKRSGMLPQVTFPHSLKKVTLRQCIVPETCLKEIGLLPNLLILKLQGITMESSTWKTSAGDFSQLQYLLLEDLNLVKWQAHETDLPSIRKLVIRRCPSLMITQTPAVLWIREWHNWIKNRDISEENMPAMDKVHRYMVEKLLNCPRERNFRRITATYDKPLIIPRTRLTTGLGLFKNKK